MRELVNGPNDNTFAGYESTIVVDSNSETVSVALAVDFPAMFAIVFQEKDLSVSANAVATVVRQTDNGCLYILDPESTNSLMTTGRSTIVATGCVINVHSTASPAVSATGNSGMIAQSYCVAGDTYGSAIQGEITTQCRVNPDPYASLTIPKGGDCDYNFLRVKGDRTLNPGVYCGGIFVNSQSKVTLNPGVYFIRDGKFEIEGRAIVHVEQSTLVLEGDGRIERTGQGELFMSPSTSGPLEGFSIVQSRFAPVDLQSRIAGGGVVEISGAVYTPLMNFTLAGNSATSVDAPRYSYFVANRLVTAGTADILFEKGTDPGNTGPEDTVRLVN
ncbi:hypothetical protein GCM10009069_29620 [Algimonas arctica]|uniref:Uncharacterized protein n=1 Tax=Algimonas arctica TaxID=1479486 RepID=A0A8J3CUF3_9PROT|nr:hypothetical protein [Algimonas arctica]GHB05178.1 hypothetical protein GCM10009069_29620 [Algimonas arctica]